VRQKLSFLALLLAWLCANGAVLDVAQVFAWTRMFAGYAHTMSASAALNATLDPAKKCALCKHIAAAKEQANPAPQSSAPVSSSSHDLAKIVLMLHTPAPFVVAASRETWPPAHASVATTRRDTVPVPPPRA
jgi:hypothetical protein